MTAKTKSKPASRYHPHLALHQVILQPGEEWKPFSQGWSLIHVGKGEGYCISPQENHALETGAVFLATAVCGVTFRASQLGELELCAYNVIPTRLNGLVAFSEQQLFEAAAAKKETRFNVYPPDSQIARRINDFKVGNEQAGLLFRIELFRLFVELFGKNLRSTSKVIALSQSDARERLKTFLENSPAAEILELSFKELAQIIQCTPRHLGRLFHELVGQTFCDRRTELRLAKARELLSSSDAKVVDVAFESGYRSLSLFNLMFSRSHGTSPGQWRKNHAGISKTR